MSLRKSKRLTRFLAVFLIFSLFFEQAGFCQEVVQLNLARHFSSLSSSFNQEKFRPLHLRALELSQQKGSFNLVLDKGDLEKSLKSQDSGLRNNTSQFIEETTQKLWEYFLVGLSLPNESFWVNLRPDSPEDILDCLLETTDLGRVLLEADLQLKKDTSLATHPQTPEGKEYWRRLYQKAEELFGSENITIPTLTRPWIVPGEIIIRETPTSAYIYKATLKVMLEEDYLKSQDSGFKSQVEYSFKDPRLKLLNEYSTQLFKELILPKLNQKVNSSKDYASLRQVFYSLILAQWFKERFQTQPNPYSHLINQKDLTGLTSKVPWSKTTFYDSYKKSFSEGEYNLKIPTHTPYGQSIRSYVSGGIRIYPIMPAQVGEMKNTAGGILISIKGNPNIVFKSGESITLQIAEEKGKLPDIRITGEISKLDTTDYSKSSTVLSEKFSQAPEDALKFQQIKARNHNLIHLNSLFIQLALAELWSSYADLAVELIGVKIFSSIGQVNEILASFKSAALAEPGNLNIWDSYADIAIKAIEEKIFKTTSDLAEVLTTIKESGLLNVYSKVFIKAIEAKIINDHSEIEAAANLLKKSHMWHEYATIRLAAYNAKIFSGFPELTESLKHLLASQKFHFYVELVVKSIDSKLLISPLVLKEILADLEKVALDNPENGELLSFYSKIVIRAIEAKIFSHPSDLNEIFSFLNRPGWFSAYTDIAIRAIEEGIFTDKSELEVIFSTLRDYRQWDHLIRSMITAFRAKVLNNPQDISAILRRFLPRLKTEGDWLTYFSLAIEAYHAKIVEEPPDLNVLLDKIENIEVGYRDLLIKTIVPKIIDNYNDLILLLSDFAEHSSLRFYIDVVLKKAMEEKILTNRWQVEEVLKIVRSFRWNNLDSEFLKRYYCVKIIEKAIEQRIFKTYNELADIVYDLETAALADARYLEIYADLIKAMIKWKIIDFSYLDELSQLAQAYDLSVFVVAILEGLKREIGLSSAEYLRICEKAKSVLKQIELQYKHIEPTGQIDYHLSKLHFLAGLVNIMAISDTVAGQIVDNYLKQRGYLPLLMDILAEAADIPARAIGNLRKLYFEKRKDNQFVNNPNFFIALIGHVRAYQLLGLANDEFIQDLMQDVTSTIAISANLGEKEIRTLSRKFGIEINYLSIKETGKSIASILDMRYLGILLSTYNRWSDDERKYFRVLLKAMLEGWGNQLIFPTREINLNYPEYLIPEDKDIVLSIQRYNRKLLKELEELGLDISLLFSLNDRIKPVITGEITWQANRQGALSALRKALNQLKVWMDSQSDSEKELRWDNFKRKLGISNLDSLNEQIFSQENLNKLEKQLGYLISKFPQGKVPEVLVDVLASVQNLKQAMQKKDRINNEVFKIRFWERNIGRDIFLGNYAGSCTSLSSNASAVFQFILDLGTQYVIIEDSKGNIKGYARFFLGYNKRNEPCIFIDSVDGFYALANNTYLRQHIQSFAKTMGIKLENIYDRENNLLSAKIGGALAPSYFHHSGIMIAWSQMSRDIDTWQPKAGWTAFQNLSVDYNQPPHLNMGGISAQRKKEVLQKFFSHPHPAELLMQPGLSSEVALVVQEALSTPESEHYQPLKNILSALSLKELFLLRELMDAEYRDLLKPFISSFKLEAVTNAKEDKSREYNSWFNRRVTLNLPEDKLRANHALIKEKKQEILLATSGKVNPNNLSDFDFERYFAALERHLKRALEAVDLNPEKLESIILEFQHDILEPFFIQAWGAGYDGDGKAMKEILQEIFSPMNEQIIQEDPLRFAVKIFCEIVRAQPFFNGNHRVADFVLNFILLKNGLNYFLLTPENVIRYYQLFNYPSLNDNEYSFEQLISFFRQELAEGNIRGEFLSSDEFGDSNSSTTPVKKGGIDLRSLPIITEKLGVDSSFWLDSNFSLDKNWQSRLQEIRHLIQTGIVPSSLRLREFVVCFIQSQDFSKEALDKVLSCFASILRLQEERCLETDEFLLTLLTQFEKLKY